MQVPSGASSLVVLRGDQASIEPEVLGPRILERTGQCIETISDCRELTYLGTGEAHLVIAVLKTLESASERNERIKHAPENEIQYSDHKQDRGSSDRRQCDAVLPRFG